MYKTPPVARNEGTRCLGPIVIDAEICDPDPVGLAIAGEIEAFFRRFVILPRDEDFVALVLWTLFVHAHDAFIISAILAIISPTKRSAKTRLLEILSHVVPRPLLASHTTAAGLFRAIDKYCPTLLIDEGDTFIKRSEDLRSLLNSGHTRSWRGCSEPIGSILPGLQKPLPQSACCLTRSKIGPSPFASNASGLANEWRGCARMSWSTWISVTGPPSGLPNIWML